MIGALTIPKNKVQLARAITNSNIKSVLVLNDVTKIEVSDKNNSIEKFIVIQVLGQDEMLAGIYDPEWGLTLPSARHGMVALKENIPKTLNIFRGSNPQRQTGIQSRFLALPRKG